MPVGFVNLLKPPGLTSAQTVGVARRRLGERQIGHTGTLDPLAAGVLPLAVGWATRLIPYLPTTATDKTYVAEAWLGRRTDTEDSSGRVLLESVVPDVDADELAALLQAMVGHKQQIPPMASALHHHGKRLYHLFRAGLEVERAPRDIYIERIELLRWRSPRLLFRVVCSAGTYVRTLCHEVGVQLGCGACMSFLVRTRSGAFDIKSAVTLESLGCESLMDPNWPLQGVPALLLTQPQLAMVRHGRSFEVGESSWAGSQPRLGGHPHSPVASPLPNGAEDYLRVPRPSARAEEAPTVRLLDLQGRLVAMARPKEGLWHPVCVFPSMTI